MTLVEGFANDFNNPMEELKKVRRVGSVKEYQSIFENGGSEESYQVYLTNSWFYEECIVIHRRRLSREEMNEKKANGLCFFCDKRYEIDEIQVMYLSRNLQYYGDELTMVTDNDEINPPIEVCRQHCCQELRDIDTQCRCPALLKMVMQEPGTQGQEAEPMLGKARYLPRICNIQPTQCDF
ncbi:putative ABC transporter B family member 18-like [Capsicum annuum]|uniref:Bifunctional inhibitor/plant lipid transfer protein/seed storage helical domain-containing protein n=1 Tax=Capsicum annuum TaxID=4072 RepID=A0A2G3A7A3_CAPAN|nr:putative ABC transporter B family member 18-like [Capsicum annuum]PHT90112.1 hypothetical protein T459_05225 [Capsicum annuum]